MYIDFPCRPELSILIGWYEPIENICKMHINLVLFYLFPRLDKISLDGFPLTTYEYEALVLFNELVTFKE